MNLPGALLRFFFNGALRLHAARRAHVANVHEMVCDRSACFWLSIGWDIERQDVRSLGVRCHQPLQRLLSAGSVEEAIPACFLAHETRGSRRPPRRR
jgi:hypothetical protein